MDKDLLVVKNISKKFGGLQALDNVQFDLNPGEVHALVGENGAGKSTLMKILGGVHQPDKGDIILNGNTVQFSNPKDSLNRHISVIYQELSALLHLSVIENIYLGRMPTKNGLIDWAKMEDEVLKLLDLLNISAKPHDELKNLNIAQRQLIEIAKAVATNANIVIMDEPNSSLSKSETEKLFNIIDILKKKKVGIIYVSHKIDEILKISDRITVFRDGKYIDTIKKDENTTEDLIIQMMVGRKLERHYVKRNQDDKIILSVKNLSGEGFSDVSFDLYKGEILGFSGLVGAGRSEVMRAIFGSTPITSGSMEYNGKKIRYKHPKEAINDGIVMLQEDRKRLSLFLELPIIFNIEISALKKLKNKLFINDKKVNQVVESYVKKLRIKTDSVQDRVNSLSGGNQQKTILARWLITEPNILILDEPTHGVDVGAKAEIYDLIRNIADNGVSVVLISSELPEIISMSDRVVVMCSGKVCSTLRREDVTEETIMSFATGYRS